MTSQILFTCLSLIAGIGIPVMVALNSSLGVQLGSPNAAAVVLFLVGICATSLILVISGSYPKSLAINISPAYFLGGVIVAIYILTITWIAPRFGVGNVIFFVLVGQLISAVIIDHYGLMGAAQFSINSSRFIGLLLMAVGVFLARKVT